ncbi:ribosome silencing factor [Sulfuriroseicoccus oceanibius]|uniref:Ribosomal silencing factor RsfS n=1 Tax=Sulfuriroseicoccus oceanibius TaxID=2707525 RepID=A0A6B3L8F5_9BACT|nr:ribosome silencing factor [Sulfuriroseicoccus oceanibius]QQL44294.1 ribosome silencing factor [Sulfuriroseicoccus oceanibius]
MPSGTELDGKALAIAVAQVLEDQRGEDIVVLNLEGLSNIADYFVVCSGNSTPHLKALRREVLERLKDEHGVEAYHKDGMPDSQWVLVDFVDVIVHIFHPEKREYYALEDLWADAPQVEWKTN